MQVSRTIIDRMFSISPQDVYVMDKVEFIEEVGKHPPFYREWLNAKCGLPLSDLEELIVYIGTNSNLRTVYEEQYEMQFPDLSDPIYQELEESDHARFSCVLEAERSERIKARDEFLEQYG